MHLFGLWEEAGARESNPWPSCYDAAAISSSFYFNYLFLFDEELFQNIFHEFQRLLRRPWLYSSHSKPVKYLPLLDGILPASEQTSITIEFIKRDGGQKKT